MISWDFSSTCREDFIKYIYFTVADVRDLGWEDKCAGEEGYEDKIMTNKQKERMGQT